MADRTEQEKILDELLITIRSKRQEFTELQAEINKCLDEKLTLITKINSLRETIKSLSEQKDNLDKKLNEGNAAYKKQLKDSLDKEAEISLKDKKSDDRKSFLDNQQIELDKGNEKLREDNLSLKRKQAKYEDDVRILNKDQSKTNSDKVVFERQKQDFEKTKSEYQIKFSNLDSKQNQAVANLEKSEDLKKILDSKIAESDLAKIQLNTLYKVNEEKQKELDKSLDMVKIKQAKLDEAILSTKKEKDNLVLKIKQQEEMDKEIEIRRLRVEKLARDKGLAEELKRLETELGIKKD